MNVKKILTEEYNARLLAMFKKFDEVFPNINLERIEVTILYTSFTFFWWFEDPSVISPEVLMGVKEEDLVKELNKLPGTRASYPSGRHIGKEELENDYIDCLNGRRHSLLRFNFTGNIKTAGGRGPFFQHWFDYSFYTHELSCLQVGDLYHNKGVYKAMLFGLPPETALQYFLKRASEPKSIE